MVLEATCFLGNKIVAMKQVEINDTKHSLAEQVEAGLRYLAKEMDFMYPLWLPKNTKEFSQFRQTIFFAEQFQEKIYFDRLQIKWVESCV